MSPVHAQHPDLGEACRGFVVALRDYADLWESELRRAVNHAPHGSLVMRVQMHGDEELAGLLFDDAA